jgi:hypothetical protein
LAKLVQELFFRQLITRKVFEKADAVKVKVFDRTKIKQADKKFVYSAELNKSHNSRLYDPSKLSLRRKPYERVTSVSKSYDASRRSIVHTTTDNNRVIFNIRSKDQQNAKHDQGQRGDTGISMLDLERKQRKHKSKLRTLNLQKQPEGQSAFYSLDFISQKQWVLYY